MKKAITTVLGTYLNTMAVLSPKIAGRHGFKVFCYPYRNTLKPFHREFLDTAEKFSFDHKCTYIQGYKWGTGAKKLLFVHGWQSHSFRWKNYIQAFSGEEYTIYALDAPGHGLSKGSYLTVPFYSEVITRFLTDIGGADAVVSHSIGAFSMLYALYATPSLAVGKLVMMASPENAMDFIEFYKQTLKLSDRSTRLTMRHFEEAIGKPIQYFSASRFAAEIKIPGLIIHDKGDAEAAYNTALAVNKVWKNSSLLTTEGLGHNLKSPAIVEAVVDFVEGNELAVADKAKSKGYILDT